MSLPKKKPPMPADIVREMEENPEIIKFEVKCDKKSGCMQTNATKYDGSRLVRTEISPGLNKTYTYDPCNSTTKERNSNILKLLDSGMTQTEVSHVIGVSQSLVSKIKIESEQE